MLLQKKPFFIKGKKKGEVFSKVTIDSINFIKNQKGEFA